MGTPSKNMSHDLSAVKLMLLPLQVIQVHDGVILKRGCSEFKITGEGAVETIPILVRKMKGAPVTFEELCECFASTDRPMVKEFVSRLMQARLLVPCEGVQPACSRAETNLDIFYWHFGSSAHDAKRQLNRHRIVIQGVNGISRQLVLALANSGWENVVVVDEPSLRNLFFFDRAGRLLPSSWHQNHKPPINLEQWANKPEVTSSDCLVATSDVGASEAMRRWNEYAIEQSCHFFPIVLRNGTGYVGPFIVPGETACYECLRLRQNANMDETEPHWATEAVAFEGQDVSGFHPSMTSILADIAGMELTKFYGGLLPWRNAGVLIEINLLIPSLQARKVLKIPRCIICSPMRRRPSKSPFRVGT